MKKYLKITLCIFMTCLCTACSTRPASVSEFSNSETTVNQANNEVPAEIEDYSIFGDSLQDFNEKLSGNAPQSVQSSCIIQAANKLPLNIEEYSIRRVIFSQNIDSPNATIKVYWHKKNCSSCFVDEWECVKFRWNLIYLERGVAKGGILRGYSQIGDSKLYTMQVARNQTSYIYLINEQYFCRFEIQNDVKELNEIADQFFRFGEEIKPLFNTDVIQ